MVHLVPRGLVVSLVLAGSAQGAAQSPARLLPSSRATVHREIPSLTASRTTTPLVADGRLDEAAWSLAQPAGQFVQRRPRAGDAATRATVARVLYDAQALWIGIRLEEPDPSGPRTALGRRDYDLPTDWVHVLIDSYQDRRTAFRFAVNPAGVMQDGSLSGDLETNEDRGWNAVWTVATRREAGAWIAEFRIPWSALRFRSAPDSADRLGIQFIRDDATRNERSEWAPIPPTAVGFVSRFGRLEGLALRALPRRIEVVPYAVTKLAPTGDALATRRPSMRPSLDAGLDLRVGLASSATVTATLRPDFGQVEADPSEVNLTAVETFLAEQRPFFLEGSEIFQLPLWGMPWQLGSSALFYSRRIGRSPQIGLPAGARAISAPGPAPIMGAAKLTAKTAGGWTLGILDARTAAVEARYKVGEGTIGRGRIEPPANYGMLRLARDFRGGASAVGFSLTSTTRSLDSASVDVLHRSAHVGGIDTRHRVGNHNVRLMAMASDVRGSAAAIARTQRNTVHLFQRPDSRVPLDTALRALSGFSADALYWRGGGSWRWGLLQHVVSSGFEANDLGYQPVSDQYSAGGWIGHEHTTPTPLLRSWSWYLNGRSQRSLDGTLRDAALSLFADAELASGWRVETLLGRGSGGVDVQALRGGPGLRTPAYLTGWVAVIADPRSRVSGQVRFTARRDDDEGTRSYAVRPILSVRPSSRAELTVLPAFSSTVASSQFVANVTDSSEVAHSIVGGLRQATASLGVRASYTFTPDLTLQLWAQPFASAGRYGDLRYVVDARARDESRRLRPISPGLDVSDPDFHTRQLRSNVVLRWEFDAGSSLYLVWSQERDDSELVGPALRLAADASRLLAVPPRNVLLAKVSLWRPL